jgi:NitT/TauT family transport system permease protein
MTTSTLTRYLPLLILALAWELASRLGLVSSLALPPLSKVAEAWVALVRSDELVTNGLSSLYRGGVGLALSIVIGAALGILMAWWRPLNIALGPLVELFYPLPKSALIPVTVLWLGLGDASKILLISVGRRGAERDARVVERHPDRARALLHSSGELGADRRPEGPRVSDRLSRLQWIL